MDQDLDARIKPWDQSVVDALKERERRDACIAALTMAGHQAAAIHTMCLTRNALNKNADGYEQKKGFLDIAIVILEREMVELMEQAKAQWPPK